MYLYVIIEDIAGDDFSRFISYALESSDYFMLVYQKIRKYPYKKNIKRIKEQLRPFQVKTRHDPCWPPYGGYPQSPTDWQYDICFYYACQEVREILLQPGSLFSFGDPLYPKDLCFFRGNQCWFASETIVQRAVLFAPAEADFAFFEDITIYKIEDDDRHYRMEEKLEDIPKRPLR